MSSQNKIILDLCGGTGAWSKPYKEAGYTVHVITHPDYDLFDSFREDDYIIFPSKTAARLEIPIRKVYGILAAPTCTMFSLARTTAKTPRDLRKGFELVRVCLGLIQECRFDGGLKFWALENPMGYLRQVLGKPPLTFDPSDYGATYTKKTDLWGYYNSPKKSGRQLTEEERARCAINNRILPELPEGYVLPKDFRAQQARRSMTDEHFATAFFKANK